MEYVQYQRQPFPVSRRTVYMEAVESNHPMNLMNKTFEVIKKLNCP